MDRFHVRKDPTLLFGGIKSPWQHYMAKLPIRLNTQLIISSPADEEWDNSFNDAFITKLCNGLDLGSDQQNGFDMKVPLGMLLMEFKHLRPGGLRSLYRSSSRSSNAILSRRRITYSQ